MGAVGGGAQQQQELPPLKPLRTRSKLAGGGGRDGRELGSVRRRRRRAHPHALADAVVPVEGRRRGELGERLAHGRQRLNPLLALL